MKIILTEKQIRTIVSEQISYDEAILQRDDLQHEFDNLDIIRLNQIDNHNNEVESLIKNIDEYQEEIEHLTR